MIWAGIVLFVSLWLLTKPEEKQYPKAIAAPEEEVMEAVIVVRDDGKTDIKSLIEEDMNKTE